MKDKSDSFIPQMLKDLEDIQLKRSNSLDSSLWLWEEVLQDQLRKHALEQDIYWVQRIQQNWT